MTYWIFRLKTNLFLLYPLLLFFIILMLNNPCSAQEHAQQFLSALETYKTEDYAGAAKALEAIAHSGVRNGQLYYNIGNAYLKSNDVGHAILWYERALNLMPHDPDLRFNYSYARSLTKDFQETSASPLMHILFFWKYQLSSNIIIKLALLFNFLFWALALLWRTTRRRGWYYSALIILLPTIIFALTAGFNYYEVAYKTQAIVLPDKVAVRSGLKPTSTELFQLHAGAKVTIVRQMQEHVQIQFSEDKIGWVDRQVVDRI